jgi:hypothetical protein
MGSNILLGMALTLLSSLSFGFNYIWTELALSQQVDPLQICFRVGSIVCSTLGSYICFVVLPNYQETVMDPIASVGGSYAVYTISLLLITISGMLHSVSHFALLGSIGSVTTGVLNSVRSVLFDLVLLLIYWITYFPFLQPSLFTSHKDSLYLLLTLNPNFEGLYLCLQYPRCFSVTRTRSSATIGGKLPQL